MNQSLKKYFAIFAMAAAFFAAVLYLESIFNGVKNLISMLMPVLIGGAVAFVLNVPMKKFEELLMKIKRKMKWKLKEEKIRLISLILTIILLVFLVALIGTILIPNLVATVGTIIGLTQENLPGLIEKIQRIDLPIAYFNEMIDNINFASIQEAVTGKIGVYLSGLVSLTSNTLTSLFTSFIGFIIAIYILLDKDKISNQAKRVMQAYLPDKISNHLIRVGKKTCETYSNFFSGQCLEAVIIGVLIFVSLTLFQIPYASVIAILAAVLSFVPYIGSLLACFAGALFIVVVNPFAAILEIVVFQVVQFVEGQFIYPKVVGNSVGLPALLTLLAALLGGTMFGLVGMIFFIPFVAVIYTLLKESVENRLKGKKTVMRLEKKSDT